MADFTALIAQIEAYVKQNGNNEITGNGLQDILVAMVGAIGGALNDAVSDLESADTTLTNAIGDEELARAGADSTLGGRITAEEEARQGADTGLQNQINGINGKIPDDASGTNKLADKAFVQGLIDALTASIEAINDKIPSEASSSNKLADKEFVQTLTTALQNALNTLNGKVPAAATSENQLADKAFVQALTAALQNAINAINTNIGNGFVYAGVATPSGTPVSGKVAYLTAQEGTYTNYGELFVPAGISVIKHDGTDWSQEQVISMETIYRNPLMGLYDCDTSGSTAAKTVTAVGYVLPTSGGSVKVRMASHTTVDGVTLNINGTGAKDMYYKGKAAGINNTWDDGAVLNVIYDSTNDRYLAYNANAGTGDGVFDVSEYTGDDYAKLEDAIADIPVSEQHGGMMMRFVRSSDNKYVQYLYHGTSIAVADFTNTANWEKINLEDELNNLGDEIAENIGAEATSDILTSDDFSDLFFNGTKFINAGANNGIYISVIKGQTISFGITRQNCYLMTNKPEFHVIPKNLITKASILEYTIEETGYLFFNILNASEFTGIEYSLSGVGLKKDIHDKNAELQSEINTNAADIASNAESISDITEEIGGKSVSGVLDSNDYCGFYYNGTKYASATSALDGVYLKVSKGQVFTFGTRINLYHVAKEPVRGATPTVYETVLSTLEWTCDKPGYIFINMYLSSYTSIAYSIAPYGIKKEFEDIDKNDFQRLMALSAGRKILTGLAKNPFSWGTHEKAILTIRCDDGRPDVDLVTKIVSGEYGFPIVLAVPASKLGGAVTGISDQASRIGDTVLDICHYAIEHGGEILEHSINTYSSAEYDNINGIKPIFVSQKKTFMENGIELRGSGVANSTPSDSLKKALAPYLAYYYEYSDHYGLVPPYDGISVGNCDSYTFNQFKDMLDELILNKGWFTFVIHDFSIMTESAYRDMLDYLTLKVNAGDVEVKTWAEVYDSIHT